MQVSGGRRNSHEDHIPWPRSPLKDRIPADLTDLLGHQRRRSSQGTVLGGPEASRHRVAED
eukprot:1481695-Alexandrium_andersonii.AAC.1